MRKIQNEEARQIIINYIISILLLALLCYIGIATIIICIEQIKKK